MISAIRLMWHVPGFVCATALLVLFTVATARADPCRSDSFEGAAYTVCSFDLAKDDLRLFWKDAEGAPYKTFSTLADDLKAKGLMLAFAMNAGMYGADFRPIGLYVEDGKTLVQANTRSVTGAPGDIPNFYKKPNGVFYIGDKTAGILETGAYLKAAPAARFATQSGPMLVIDGAIHPAFIEGSTDEKERDGVGLSSPTGVTFAISEDAVSFHDFARFFRDHLGCQNALFLDGGSAPGLYAPEIGRNDAPGHGGYGPIAAVVTP
jgi:uncharacterized protein YigE (DUF2233 family)